jgi:hypothetical protein
MPCLALMAVTVAPVVTPGRSATVAQAAPVVVVRRAAMDSMDSSRVSPVVLAPRAVRAVPAVRVV